MSDGDLPRALDLPKALAEMSDRELDEELQRRRRLRAAKKTASSQSPITEQDRRALAVFERQMTGSSPESKSDMAAAVERADLAKHYAALELKPGATLAQVEKAYRDLLAKYDPGRHAGNPEKHRAATQLVAELTRAYQALVERSGRG